MAAELVKVTGMVLAASPVKEYDKRIELLTKERGRISAFVTGARKVNSAVSACAIPFTFGTYYLYEGRSSYNVQSAQIIRFFATIADDFDCLCYASYFAELARYFTRENVEAPRELLLLYVACSAMTKGQIPLPLMRTIYEMRMMQIEGEALELFHCLDCGREEETMKVYFQRGGFLCGKCAEKCGILSKEKGYSLSADAVYALQFILTSPLEKLFSFRVSGQIEKELSEFMTHYYEHYLHHTFQSLSFLQDPFL